MQGTTTGGITDRGTITDRPPTATISGPARSRAAEPPAVVRTPARDATAPTADRAVALRAADRAATPPSGQLRMRLANHLVPQRDPRDADVQLLLDIPAQTDRRTAAEAVAEPDHPRIARHWLVTLLETANGRRDRRQLDRLLTRGLRLRLSALNGAARPRVVHSDSPAPRTIYLAASVRLPDRCRAITAELRRDEGGSWRAVAVDLL